MYVYNVAGLWQGCGHVWTQACRRGEFLLCVCVCGGGGGGGYGYVRVSGLCIVCMGGEVWMLLKWAGYCMCGKLTRV